MPIFRKRKNMKNTMTMLFAAVAALVCFAGTEALDNAWLKGTN